MKVASKMRIFLKTQQQSRLSLTKFVFLAATLTYGVNSSSLYMIRLRTQFWEPFMRCMWAAMKVSCKILCEVTRIGDHFMHLILQRVLKLSWMDAFFTRSWLWGHWMNVCRYTREKPCPRGKDGTTLWLILGSHAEFFCALQIRGVQR